MKKQIIFSFLASLFLVGSLSAQSGSQEESELTLGVRAADCVCEVVTLAAQLKRELDVASEDEREALQEKAGKLVMETTCMQEIELEIKAVPEEEQAEMEAEMKARMKVKCGDAMRELGMPEED